jgi:putative hydrolase of the HAD superfamily
MTQTMKPILIFDMDDTLIPTQDVFNQTSLLVAKSLVRYLSLNVETSEIIQKMNEIDLGNVKEMGFSPERFPTSWVQTFEWYANLYQKEITSEQKDDIYKKAYSLYELVINPYPLTHETLSLLKTSGYPLFLLTAGTTSIQEKRIADARLADYFKELIIVPMKNPMVLKELLTERKIEPSEAYMIGNSLKSDIYPALEVGMKVIHVERDTWAYDNYQVDKNREEYNVIHSLEELIPLFKKEQIIE